MEEDHHQQQQPSRPPSVNSVHLGSTYSGFLPYSGQEQHHSLPHMGHHYNYQQQQQPPQQYQYQQQQLYQQYQQQQQPQQYQQQQQQQQYQQQQYQQYLQQQQYLQYHQQQYYAQQQPNIQRIYGYSQLYPGTQGFPQNDAQMSQNRINYLAKLKFVDFIKEIQQRQAQNRASIVTPMMIRPGTIYPKAAFSQNNNQLLVRHSKTQVAFYALKEVFVERCYPTLHLQSLLTDGANGTTPGKTLLPFNDPQIAIDWMKIKSSNDSNYELKLVLKVLTMLFKQKGVVTGLELSGKFICYLPSVLDISNLFSLPITEHLLEIIPGNTTTLNDSIDYNSNLDRSSQAESTDRPTQGPGFDRPTQEQLLGSLRQTLMRGQKRVAINFAQGNGLYDHAMSLVFLTTFQPSGGSQLDNALMISTIKKFITSTLEPSDPSK